MGNRQSRPEDERPSKDLTRWRKAGEIEDIRRIQWRAVKAAERIMYDPKASRAEILKATTRITQAVQAYLKVMEAHELEERVEALEEAMQRQGTTNGMYHN